MVTKYLPQVLPDFSENEEYPAGVDPWSGGPTKVEPSSTIRNEGIAPNDQMAAEHYNWLNYRYGRAIKALVHGAMQRWQSSPVRVEAVETVNATSYTLQAARLAGHVVASCAIVVSDIAAAPAHHSLAVAGEASQILGSSHGLRWEELEPIADTALIDLVGDMPGVLFALRDSVRHIDRSVDFGENWITSTNVSPASGTLCALLVSGARVLASIQGAADASANRVYVSDDSGATWTAKSIGSANYTITSWATNGAGTIVAYAQNAGFGGSDKILYSTNNGNTWAVGMTVTNAVDVGTVCYSPVWDQFVVVNTEEKLFNSADGASWATRTGFGFLPTSTRAIASVGSVLCMSVELTLTTSPAVKTLPGVVYSFDFGANWHFVPLGPTDDSALRVHTVRAHGGRFVAGARGCIYLSGVLWDPAADLIV